MNLLDSSVYKQCIYICKCLHLLVLSWPSTFPGVAAVPDPLQASKSVTLSIFTAGSTPCSHFICLSIYLSIHLSISLVAQTVKNLPAMWEIWVWSLGWEDPLEKGMATLSSILAWRIPWTEEPGELQSLGSQRVGHDWVTNTRSVDRLIDLSIHPSIHSTIHYKGNREEGVKGFQVFSLVSSIFRELFLPCPLESPGLITFRTKCEMLPLSRVLHGGRASWDLLLQAAST